MLVYDKELALIGYEVSRDEIGNEIKTSVKKNILCRTADIGSAEFYDAKINGLKPEIKFTIHGFEYNGETEVEFEGGIYQVIRTYNGDTIDRSDNALSGEEIELTCERKIGNVE